MAAFHDCYVVRDGTRITVGNDRIERCWDLSRGVPVTFSLRDKATGEEWIDAARPVPMFNSSSIAGAGSVRFNIETSTSDDHAIAKEHLLVKLRLRYARCEVELATRVYPGLPFLRHEVTITKIDAAAEHADGATTEWDGPELPVDDNNREAAGLPSDYVDALAIRETHARWSSAALRDVTDHNNNLVSEDHGLFYISEKRTLSAGIVQITNPFNQHGLFFIKESPTAFGHLRYPGHDYLFKGRHLFMTGSGVQESELNPNEPLPMYGSVVGVCTEGELGSLRALHSYHEAVRRYDETKDCFVMSNTWGDRSKDGRVSEAFLLEELNAAAEAGVDIVQIDDGWQQGATANSVVSGGVWSGYYEHQNNFWHVHSDRFPNGLEPVVRRAEELGVSLGLWFSPDSSDDFTNWQRDAQTLISLSRRYNIRFFKLDAINLKAKSGEVRLLRMMEEVIGASGGKIVFNLDTTAQVRLGYYGRNQYGCLFLENRYTDWQNYYPHYTLRNLWMLSKYVPTRRLQMEFLNVNRNTDRYGDDPLAPAHCGFAYSFGVTMAANPLAWMELSGLGGENRRLLAGMLAAYRNVHADFLRGTVLPIGEEPSGFAWTGFQSLQPSGREGMLLIYREHHSESTFAFKLWGADRQTLELQTLLQWENGQWAGDGIQPVATSQVQPDSAGQYSIQLSSPHSFALLRYRSI